MNVTSYNNLALVKWQIYKIRRSSKASKRRCLRLRCSPKLWVEYLECFEQVQKGINLVIFRNLKKNSNIIRISISCLSFRKDLDFSREILSSDLFGLVRVEMNQFMSKHISSYQSTCLLDLTVIGLSTVFETSIKPFHIDDLDI